MKNNILQFDECSNCGACYNICPKDAITVSEDNFFYKLEVDDEKCINCGRCVKVCPVNMPQIKSNVISAIGGSSKDSKTVKKSSSGGAFSVIADFVLTQNGVVFGAVYDEDNRTVRIKSSNEVGLDKILKSKYVESLVGDSFRKVKDFLKNGRVVLFCGCPCQVAGLKRYLEKDYLNLYTCDFSCGGLPSHRIYNDYLSSLEEKYNAKVSKVDFRAKTQGWDTHAIRVCFDNKKQYNSLAQLDPYFYGFIYTHYTVRDNCLKCKFADNHYADIILADFWAYKSMSSLKSSGGLSLVISNTEKGNDLLEKIKPNMNYEDLDLEKASYNLKSFVYGDEYLKNRKEFLDNYLNNGFDFLFTLLPRGKEKFIVNLKTSVKKVYRFMERHS